MSEPLTTEELVRWRRAADRAGHGPLSAVRRLLDEVERLTRERDLDGEQMNRQADRIVTLERERDEARAKLDALLYQYRACHAEKDGARALARRLAGHLRSINLGTSDAINAAIAAFDVEPWREE